MKNPDEEGSSGGVSDTSSAPSDDKNRCNRNDGKRWRCREVRVEGKSFCEKHLSRMSKTSLKTKETSTSSSQRKMRGRKISSSGGGGCDGVTAGTDSLPSDKRCTRSAKRWRCNEARVEGRTLCQRHIYQARDNSKRFQMSKVRTRENDVNVKDSTSIYSQGGRKSSGDLVMEMEKEDVQKTNRSSVRLMKRSRERSDGFDDDDDEGEEEKGIDKAAEEKQRKKKKTQEMNKPGSKRKRESEATGEENNIRKQINDVARSIIGALPLTTTCSVLDSADLIISDTLGKVLFFLEPLADSLLAQKQELEQARRKASNRRLQFDSALAELEIKSSELSQKSNALDEVSEKFALALTDLSISQGRVSELEAELKTKIEDEAQVKEECLRMKAKLAQMESKVTKLEAESVTKGERVTSPESEMTQLESKVTELGVESATKGERVTSLERKMGQLESKVTAEFATNGERVNSLERKMAGVLKTREEDEKALKVWKKCFKDAKALRQTSSL